MRGDNSDFLRALGVRLGGGRERGEMLLLLGLLSSGLRGGVTNSKPILEIERDLGLGGKVGDVSLLLPNNCDRLDPASGDPTRSSEGGANSLSSLVKE